MEDIWHPLAEGRSPLVYAPGRLIYLQGEEARQFYYILSGSVKIFISSDEGNERTLTQHHAGSLIGESSFFDKQPRVSSAVAVTQCELVSVDREHLSEVFAHHPDLAVSMLEYLARTIRLLSGHVDGSFLRADRRLARHLLSLPTGPDGAVPCTHEELGFAMGASRVTVSRVLAEFERRTWLKTGYRTVILTDRTALEDFADGLLTPPST